MIETPLVWGKHALLQTDNRLKIGPFLHPHFSDDISCTDLKSLVLIWWCVFLRKWMVILGAIIEKGVFVEDREFLPYGVTRLIHSYSEFRQIYVESF